MSDDHSNESKSINLERCDKLGTRHAEHTVGVAGEPRRTMDKRFVQGWAASILAGSLDSIRGKRTADSSKNRQQ